MKLISLLSFIAVSLMISGCGPDSDSTLPSKVETHYNGVVVDIIGMTNIPNYVKMKKSTPYGSDYFISDSEITDGQDPDGNIAPGKTLDWEYHNDDDFTGWGFVYECGRKGSSDVAKWWSDEFRKNQNTFNSNPDKLNFASVGNLTLNVEIINSTGWPESTAPYTFEGIGFGQGHTGAANNWWFGGKNCVFTSSYIFGANDNETGMVFCTGQDATGSEAGFAFLRGGNPDDQVDVMPFYFSTKIDTANWMSELDPNVSLNNIMMPGSHDAGMAFLSDCDPAVDMYGKSITQSQFLTIGHQLESGVRYFDIRVKFVQITNQLTTYHGNPGCDGQSIDSVLTDAVNFLNLNKGETVILKFSHFLGLDMEYEEYDQLAVHALKNLLTQYEDYLYKDSDNQYGGNLAHFPLNEVAGKIIAVIDDNTIIDPAQGRFRYADGEVKIDHNSKVCSGDDPNDCICEHIERSNLSVCDNYSNKKTFSDMLPYQLEAWERFGGLGKDRLFLLSWTVTGGFKRDPLATHAMEANYNLPNYLYEYIENRGYGKPNIVYTDMVNKGTSQAIIQYNFPALYE